MASATGIPEDRLAAINESGEEEPLLGRPGDVTQTERGSFCVNMVTGTAVLAQAGIWITAALVWSAIFSNKLIFFSPHALLNSAAVLLTTQSILLLQPTHTPTQKKQGALVHFGILAVSNISFLAAFIIIELNKASHPETRFTSVHGIIGLITYILIVLQATVGVAQYFFPAQVFGSIANGKQIYKWHRLSGYLLLLMELATIAAATQTTYNLNVLGIELWYVLIAEVLVVAGVFARIKRQKVALLAKRDGERPRERED